ncbi:MAG: TolC family protein, partial [Gemmataceae bacterium]
MVRGVRINPRLIVLLVLATMAGCSSTRELPAPAHGDAVSKFTMLDCKEPVPVNYWPAAEIPARVRTVLDPEAPQRPISLTECIALALENGRLNSTGIRVLAYDPAIYATEIEQSLAKFDAQMEIDTIWDTLDEPVGTADQSNLGAPDAIIENNAEMNAQMFKLLPTGGVAGITFTTDYQLSNLTASVNPAYQPVLQFNFEQPLLRGAGIAINQLLSSHPGSVLTDNLDTGGLVDGILITRVTFDQKQIDFEKNLQDLLLDVEKAYWNLYYSYWNLYGQEAALRQTLTAWETAKKRFAASQFTVQDLALIEAQYQAFRSSRVQALGQGSSQAGVLEAERQLRLAIGLPLEDGERLVPSDKPSVAEMRPNWQQAVNDALARRPDLRSAAASVKLAQLNYELERNQLLPDFRLYSDYNVNSVGSRLDGPGADNALRNLAQNRYHTWEIGLRLLVPVGFRAANARARRAYLQLLQENATLRNAEERAIFELGSSYRELVQTQVEMRIQAAQRKAAERQLRARYIEFANSQGIIFVLLQAQQTWVDALLAEQLAIVDYNIA